eukprot:5429422-Pleurochrysis_carterae.AAC.1
MRDTTSTTLDKDAFLALRLTLSPTVPANCRLCPPQRDFVPTVRVLLSRQRHIDFARHVTHWLTADVQQTFSYPY